MRNEVQHTHIFSGLFIKSPQLSNILSRINIGVTNTATVWTSKILAIPITNHFAHIADFTRIARINYNKRDTSKFSLVFKKRTELGESPGVMSSSLSFSYRSSFSDVGQVFNSNPFSFGYSLFYNSLCYGVIGNSGESLFSAFKPFQELSASCCAFALNGFTHFEIFISNLVQLFRIKTCSIRKCSYVGYSKIHPYKFLNIFNIIFRNFNSLKKIKLAFFINKVCFPFDIRQIFRIMAKKRYFQSAVNRPNGGNLFFNIIRKNTRIISNSTKRFKSSLNFFVKFISINYLTNTTNKHLGRKLSNLFQGVINEMVNLKLVKNFLFPYHIGNLVTGIISLFKSCQKRFCLFIRRKKFYLQGKFHSDNIYQMFEYVKRNLLRKEDGQFIRQLKQAVSLPCFL